MARGVVRQSLAEQLARLFETDPRAAEWSVLDLASHLGRNERSIKEHPMFRAVMAEREGADLAGPERDALKALAAVSAGGRSATLGEVAAEAGRSPGLVRRRLSALVGRGYASSRNGDPSQSGYTITPAGIKALRLGQKRTGSKRRGPR